MGVPSLFVGRQFDDGGAGQRMPEGHPAGAGVDLDQSRSLGRVERLRSPQLSRGAADGLQITGAVQGSQQQLAARLVRQVADPRREQSLQPPAERSWGRTR